jgi:hypothetical protein
MMVKVNSLGKTTDSPNQNARAPRTAPVFLNPLVVMSVGVAIAAGLAVVAAQLFAHSNRDSFSRKFAEFVLQLALIVIIGALINFFFKVYSDRRALLDQDNTNRLELLRRMRAVHVTVAYAQRLIVADNSGRTYSEQLRRFMILTYELEDIAEDIEVASKRKLFEPFDDVIIKGIKGIINFLNQLTGEYVRCRSDVEADAELNKDFAATIEERGMCYLKEFIKVCPEFPTLYKISVDMSKGKMREKIYGLRE